MAKSRSVKTTSPRRPKAVRATITGVHGHLPDYVLTNAELAQMVDTTDAWITERTGIRERHILKGKGLGTSHMGAEAVRGLLEKTRTLPKEVDLLICATTTPDFVFPSTANLICDMVGIRNVGSFDVQAACSGFLYSLTIGAQFIAAGTARKVIVVGADKMSSIIDYTDRATCVLFGDAAGAVLLEPDEQGYGIMDSLIRSDGSGWIHLHQKAGGSRMTSAAMTPLSSKSVWRKFFKSCRATMPMRRPVSSTTGRKLFALVRKRSLISGKVVFSFTGGTGACMMSPTVFSVAAPRRTFSRVSSSPFRRSGSV